MNIGQSASYIASVTDIKNGTVSKVTFSSSNNGIVESSGSDTSHPYITTATAVSLGTATITAEAVMGWAVVCFNTASVTVTLPGPWWQVKDGDVTTNGDINSTLPPTAGLYFDTTGSGGYPGIAKYGGSTSLSSAKVSVKSWLANFQVVGRFRA
jgi:hypothetical protein